MIDPDTKFDWAFRIGWLALPIVCGLIWPERAQAFWINTAFITAMWAWFDTVRIRRHIYRVEEADRKAKSRAARRAINYRQQTR